MIWTCPDWSLGLSSANGSLLLVKMDDLYTSLHRTLPRSLESLGPCLLALHIPRNQFPEDMLHELSGAQGEADLYSSPHAPFSLS